MLKKLSFFILICAFLGAALAVYANYFLKPLLEERLLDAARSALGEGLEISGIDLSLTQAAVYLKGLSVEDCKISKYRDAISADEVYICIDPASTLLQQRMVVKKAVLRKLIYDLSDRMSPAVSREIETVEPGQGRPEDQSAGWATRSLTASLGDRFKRVRLDSVVIEDSYFRFSDYSVRPSPNVIEIADLNGSIDMISFTPGRNGILEGAVSLNGRVRPNGRGAFKLDGSFTAAGSGLDFDLVLAIDGVSLSLFEPYYSKTSLTILKEAKVDLSSKARCSSGNLKAFQTARLYNIELYDIKPGEEDKLFGLPAKTVVDFFKNSKGDVKFDFNISGTLTDPKFEPGPVIQQVLTKALQDRIMATIQGLPGRMLERAIGGNISESGGVSLPGDKKIDEALQKVQTKIKKLMEFKP